MESEVEIEVENDERFLNVPLEERDTSNRTSNSNENEGEGSENFEDDEPPLEPRFKYDRMDGTDAKQMLSKEILTSVVVHDKFIAIGTQSGSIWVLDHTGFADLKNIPVIRAHRCAVAHISVEESGAYILSIGNDARVVISGIGNDRFNCIISVQAMPKSAAIAPLFSVTENTPAFIVGERKLLLFEKKLFQYRSTTIFEGTERDGFINCCSWYNDYIAFTCDSGTVVHDRRTNSRITHVRPTHDVDRVRSARCPPQHTWLPDGCLVIGWVESITILAIKMHNGKPRGEIHYKWTVPMFISGISYTLDKFFQWKDIFVIGLRIDNEDFDDGMSTVSIATTLTAFDNSATSVIQTCVLAPLNSNEYDLLSEDTLNSVNMGRNKMPRGIKVASLPHFNTYFIMTNVDLIVATPYSVLDIVKFRLKYKQWNEAFELAQANEDELEGSELSSKKVGRMLIEAYFAYDRLKVAAALLPQVCGGNKEEWQWAVEKFQLANQSTLLAEVLPTSDPKLDPKQYESVLKAALLTDAKLFKKLVQSWSPDLYKTSNIINETLWQIREITRTLTGTEVAIDERTLYEALAHLYVYERKYEYALKIYVSNRDPQIFNVIDKHHLFDMVKDQISDLMTIHADRALRLLLDNEDSVPATFVMEKISRQPKLQLAYLTKLLARNEGAEFADKAVSLYAEYERKKLLPFLRKNENYHLNKALTICRQKNYVEEMIFLLSKGGNHLEAINLMVQKFENIDKAIEYCKEQQDIELWLHLVDQVAKTPEHLPKLLEHTGSGVNPIDVLRAIPNNANLPGIDEAVKKMLAECKMQRVCWKGCRDVFRSDISTLHNEYHKLKRAGVYVSARMSCAHCSGQFSTMTEKTAEDFKIYGCGHAVHLSCETRHDHGNRECVSCKEKEF